MRLIVLAVILFHISTTVFAQDTSALKTGIQLNYMPDFQLNDEHYKNVSSVSFKLIFVDLVGLPLEFGLRFSPSYHSTIDFSYGITLAYAFIEKKNYWLKAGFDAGRIKMEKFRTVVETGKLVEDEYHQLIHPYIEWEWLFSKYVSLTLQTGYQFLNSETSRVTKILSRTEQGFPLAYKTTADLGTYGSGFTFSAGLVIPIKF